VNLITEGAVGVDVEGVFYNPRMRLNREIGVAMARALGIVEYLDAFSASGLRGLRLIQEAGVKDLIFNDVSHKAARLIEENLARNGLKGEVCCKNANVLMHERRFQAVDLDPFGTPSPFLSAASRSAEEYLFVTATDTAPLCGAHLASGIRKYMARPVKAEHHREMGARILLGLAARELARMDKGMEPLLTHATEHYVRTYLRAIPGARNADTTLEKLGYLEQCPRCGSWRTIPSPASEAEGICGRCKERTLLAGPLWLGPLKMDEVLDRAIPGLPESNHAIRLMKLCRDELDLPMYHDHHRLCRRLGIAPVRLDSLVLALQDSGFKASRTHFSGTGLKTDASREELEDLLVELDSKGGSDLREGNDRVASGARLPET